MSANMDQTAARLLRLVIRGGRKLVRDPRESTLILRMAAWVSILSLLVKFQPLPRALQMVSLNAPRDSCNPSIETEKKLARAIDILLGANLLIFKPICWKRATVLRRYLSSEGITSRILFGVRNDGSGGVAGHAWLESGGTPILESQPLDYVVTYTFPSNAPCTTELAIMSHEQN